MGILVIALDECVETEILGAYYSDNERPCAKTTGEKTNDSGFPF